jgi:hypothetical protein
MVQKCPDFKKKQEYLIMNLLTTDSFCQTKVLLILILG